jgi:S1-C subfamily serine protease
VGAWYGTVLIEGAAVIRRAEDDLRLRTNRGAGVVVDLDDAHGTALVITNCHVVDCGGAPCLLRIGFTAIGDPNLAIWTSSVTTVGSAPNKDLAFLRVAIPEGVQVMSPTFAGAGCMAGDAPSVYAIGWPDLTVRDRWGVEPPTNQDQHIKRHSSGRFLLDLDGYRLVSKANGPLHRMRVVFHNADVLPGSSGGPLVMADGSVLGINTQVVGRSDPPHARYCARQDAHDQVAECVHVAIAAEELALEFERIFRTPMPVSNCSEQLEGAVEELRAALHASALDASR